jgi:hypothetical protein
VPVLDDETATLMRGGCALIIGAVAPDGRPHALRGWGIEVLVEEPLRVRVLVDAHETEAIDHLAEGRPVAVTVADVTTLRSVQFKGRSAGIEAATEDAPDVMARYVDQFFADIAATDGIARSLLERFVPDPAALVALVLDVDEQFDQTPGPGAGRSVGADR